MDFEKPRPVRVDERITLAGGQSARALRNFGQPPDALGMPLGRLSGADLFGDFQDLLLAPSDDLLLLLDWKRGEIGSRTHGDLTTLNGMLQLGCSVIVHIDCATHRAFADVEKRGSSLLGHFKRPIGRLMRLPVPTMGHVGELRRHHGALALAQVSALEVHRDDETERIVAVVDPRQKRDACHARRGAVA